MKKTDWKEKLRDENLQQIGKKTDCFIFRNKPQKPFIRFCMIFFFVSQLYK